jgi:hypothetical protein
VVVVGFTPSSTHNPPGWAVRLMPVSLRFSHYLVFEVRFPDFWRTSGCAPNPPGLALSLEGAWLGWAGVTGHRGGQERRSLDCDCREQVAAPIPPEPVQADSRGGLLAPHFGGASPPPRRLAVVHPTGACPS